MLGFFLFFEKGQDYEFVVGHVRCKASLIYPRGVSKPGTQNKSAALILTLFQQPKFLIVFFKLAVFIISPLNALQFLLPPLLHLKNIDKVIVNIHVAKSTRHFKPYLT